MIGDLPWGWVACTYLYCLAETLCYCFFLAPVARFGRGRFAAIPGTADTPWSASAPVSAVSSAPVAHVPRVACALVAATCFWAITMVRAYEYFGWQYTLLYFALLTGFVFAYTDRGVKGSIYLAIVIALATMFVKHTVGHVFIMRYELNYLIEGADYPLRLLAVAIVAALYCGVFWVLRRFAYRCDMADLTWGQIALMALAFVPVVYINNLVTMVIRESGAGWAKGAGPLITETLCCVCGLIVVVGNEALASLKSAERDLDYAQRLLEAQYRRYADNRAMMEDVNKKYHDIKRHVAALSQLGSGEFKTEYLRALEEEISGLHPVVQTGSEILDVILADKALECEKRGAVFSCMADGEALGFMGPTDVTTIVANLLDNAIEAIGSEAGGAGGGAAGAGDAGGAGADAREPYEIQLKIARTGHGVTVIRAENTYCGDLAEGPVDLATLTHRGAGHGYGLKNVAAVAGKYAGTVSLRIDRGRFVATVAIPPRD